MKRPIGYRFVGGNQSKKYWMIKVEPTHKSPSVHSGYECQHRYVMEKHIKRYLKRKEHVIHLNGDTRDNRLMNLKIIQANEHYTLLGHMRKGKQWPKVMAKRKKRADSIVEKNVSGGMKLIKYDKKGRWYSIREAYQEVVNRRQSDVGRRNISKGMRGRSRGLYKKGAAARKIHKYWTYFKAGQEIDCREEALRTDVTPPTVVYWCRHGKADYSRKERFPKR